MAALPRFAIFFALTVKSEAMSSKCFIWQFGQCADDGEQPPHTNFRNCQQFGQNLSVPTTSYPVRRNFGFVKKQYDVCAFRLFCTNYGPAVPEIC